jgi:hypothetical protein
MAAIVLTTIQAQFLTALEATAVGAFEDGVIVPGGTPPVLEGFEGYKDYTLEQKQLGVNALKSTFTPFLVAMGTGPIYTPVTFENGFGIWGDGNYGNGLVRYSKSIDGYVHVHGLMRTPAAGAVAYVVAFTLPVGFRPAPGDARIFPCSALDTFASVQVGYDGTVLLRTAVANDGWVSLECRFYAGG